jgi:dihydrofolate reductase
MLQGIPDYIQDYARIWRAADKIVFSRSLRNVTTARTRLEHGFQVELVLSLEASADRDIAVGGANVAAQAFRAGLVDECLLLVAPVSVGGGKRGLPAGFDVRMELVGERRFDSGFVYLRLNVKR